MNLPFSSMLMLICLDLGWDWFKPSPNYCRCAYRTTVCVVICLLILCVLII